MFGFASYGPYWRHLRKITILEILTNRRVEQYQHVCVSEVQTSIKELFNIRSSKNNESHSSNYVLVDVKQWFTHLTFNMVLGMVVGKRYFGTNTIVEEKEAQRRVKALNKMMHLFWVITVGDVIPCLEWFDFGGHVKAMNETSKEMDEILSEWFEGVSPKKNIG
jgi:hypothetical protein